MNFIIIGMLLTVFNAISPKFLRKMPWDFIFTEVEEFLKVQKEKNKEQQK